MKPEQIKQLRESTGLSASKAARLVHVTERSWRRYESGERQIPEGVIELFCIKNKLEYPR